MEKKRSQHYVKGEAFLMHFNLIHHADMKTISEGLRIGFFFNNFFFNKFLLSPGPGQLSQINHFFKKKKKISVLESHDLFPPQSTWYVSYHVVSSRVC